MGGPAPLGVYIHWPYCARVCPYCDFNVVRDRGRRDEQAALVDAIAADLSAQAALLGPRRLVSIFFGGGTPSLMDPDDAGRLVALARSLWREDGPLEISLEANPTDAEAGRFAALASAGVNRLSLGVQALDDHALKFLGRNHDAAAARRAAATAATAFPRLSLDLIYALPGQTPEAWAATLGEAVDLGSEHLSPYQLTIESGTAFDRAVRRGRFAAAEPEVGAALYDTTQTVLEALGYEAYEVSNHARGAAARSRHNLVYWRGEDYVGVGPGAHGRLTTAAGRLAVEAAPGVADYIGRVRREGSGWSARESLSLVSIAEERLLMGLRTVEGVTWDALAPLGISPQCERVRTFVEAGLIVAGTDGLRATTAGRMVLDRLTAELAG
ncbi:MAG TPA: radical SAM family heme chaperone HemW [Caulobacteraceae bacterium]|jgi:oxygen-independent coproporphyrinogen-3 oxidase|nr:radical SAM family heme chaperone HemW [Caulobacteraceae bacterium]